MNSDVEISVIEKSSGAELQDYDMAILLGNRTGKHLCWADMEGYALGEGGTLWIIDECGGCEKCPPGEFWVRVKIFGNEYIFENK